MSLNSLFRHGHLEPWNVCQDQIKPSFTVSTKFITYVDRSLICSFQGRRVTMGPKRETTQAPPDLESPRVSIIHHIDDNDHLAATTVSPPRKSDLAKELRKKRIECPLRHTFFVPISDLDNLITVSVIEKVILSGNPGMKPAVARKYAETVERSAKKLFAILAYRDHGRVICSFVDRKISDDDLPLRRRRENDKWSLWRKEPEERIQVLDGSEDEDEEVEEFTRVQWWMMAPRFDKYTHELLELKDDIILPFIPAEHGTGIAQRQIGGYSEVTPFRVHPAHHNFWDADIPLVSNLTLF